MKWQESGENCKIKLVPFVEYNENNQVKEDKMGKSFSMNCEEECT
jgi:hypothetical protein